VRAIESPAVGGNFPPPVAAAQATRHQEAKTNEILRISGTFDLKSAVYTFTGAGKTPDRAMSQDITTGLILPGGGARAAYQVGVIRAINELTGCTSENPFPVISGTSAGGINAVVLASNAIDFNEGVQRLDAIWRHFSVGQVFHADSGTMARTGARWLATLATGGMAVSNPKSLLDNTPLRDLLERHVRFARIQQAIDTGHLRAAAITASGYSSAHSITFFQGIDSINEWARNRREGHRVRLNLNHTMATSAIPLIFPPVRIRGEWYGDGAVRQLAPFSAPIRLGAHRLLVIGVRNSGKNEIPTESNPAPFPSFGDISGYMLDTLFSDGLYSDIERLQRINGLVDSSTIDCGDKPVRPIDWLVIEPSQDIRDIARRHVNSLPRSFRLLLKGIGANESNPQLLSYLLFESSYTIELMELGYNDAMAQGDELRKFVAPSSDEVPEPHAVRELSA